MRRRRSLVKWVAVAWVLAWPALAGAADELPTLIPSGGLECSAELAIDVDALGVPSVSVMISVPYDELQWIKAPGGYACAVEVSLVFEARAARPGFGDLWDRRLTTRHFDHTRSTTLSLREQRSFVAAPGRYQVRVEVRDRYSQVASSVAADIVVPDFSARALGFADVRLGTLTPEGDFRATPGRRFGLDVRELVAEVAFLDRRDGPWPRRLRFGYRVLDDQEQVVVEGRTRVDLDTPATVAVVRPDSMRLFVGAYQFEVTMGEGRQAATARRSFVVDESGPPEPVVLERLLEPLAWIADPSELEHLQRLRGAEREAAWIEFWRTRDPTPDTPRNEALIEFMRRVTHVAMTYADGGPGWRSDRGRTYIRYGAPVRIETRLAGYETPALEIWYYDQPSRRFVFADHQGLGRFRLTDTEWN